MTSKQITFTTVHNSKIEKMTGCDIGYHNSVIDPVNRTGCVGKRGINKLYTFDMVLNLAFEHPDKPNIIIRGGKDAKWYMKKISPEKINEGIQKQKWRDTSRYQMYIITW